MISSLGLLPKPIGLSIDANTNPSNCLVSFAFREKLNEGEVSDVPRENPSYLVPFKNIPISRNNPVMLLLATFLTVTLNQCPYETPTGFHQFLSTVKSIICTPMRLCE
jgi:hypothetical protein